MNAHPLCDARHSALASSEGRGKGGERKDEGSNFVPGSHLPMVEPSSKPPILGERLHAGSQRSPVPGSAQSSSSDTSTLSTGSGVLRVTFSADIEHPESQAGLPTPGIMAAAGLTVDTPSSLPRHIREESLEIGSLDRHDPDNSNTNSAVEASTTPGFHYSSLPPIPPISPRKRSRGYSLRRQLFFRNVCDQTDQDAGVAHSSANDMGIELKSQAQPSFDVKGRGTDLQQKGINHDHPKRKGNFPPVAGSLPQYSLWARKQSYTFRGRIKSYYKGFRKMVLRINENPPPKEGRKIPVNAERKVPLIDKRTGKEYIGNTIRSSRYTIWSFLPKQLFAQFSKLANL